MPKLSRKQVADLITEKLTDSKLPHATFIQFTRLYIDLTADEWKRKQGAHTVKAAHQLVKAVGKDTKSKPPSTIDLVREIEQQQREQP